MDFRKKNRTIKEAKDKPNGPNRPELNWNWTKTLRTKFCSFSHVHSFFVCRYLPRSFPLFRSFCSRSLSLPISQITVSTTLHFLFRSLPLLIFIDLVKTLISLDLDSFFHLLFFSIHLMTVKNLKTFYLYRWLSIRIKWCTTHYTQLC